MKVRYFFILAFLGIFLVSCGPDASFDEPQPEGVAAISGFPSKLLGKYGSRADSFASVMVISQKMAVRVYDADIKELKKDLDSGMALNGNKLYDANGKMISPVKVHGDTITMHYHKEDTIFNMDSGNILKKFKGYYFLNIRNKSNSWEVLKMSLSGNILSVGSISGQGDIDKLREITGTQADTTNYHFKPTRKQFRKFIKANGFGYTEEYVRIKE